MDSRNASEILKDIQRNIASVEHNGATPSLLDEISHDFLTLFELLKLFLISERDTYYGYFLMNMSIELDFFRSFIAAVKLVADPPVFTCNPLILCKMSLKEIIYVVCHEIEHLLLDHPAQALISCKNEPEEALYEFNLAADASVNDRLDSEIIEMKEEFMSAPKGVINSEALKEMLELKTIKHLENYAYYFALVKKEHEKDKGKPIMGNGPDNVVDNLSKEEEESNGEEGQKSSEGQKEEGRATENGDKGEYERPMNEVVTSANHGQMEDHSWGSDDPDEVHEATKNLANAAYESMDEETRGFMPASFKEQLERLNRKPVITWEKIFKKYVGTIPNGKRKTKTRLNRRQPTRYDLSGSMPDKTLKIVVCIDTSGSVSNLMISHIFDEIFAILSKRRKEITIIECDAAVQRVYVASSRNDIKLDVQGRGGTAFTPAIEYVNANRRFRDAFLVYFTDGYGENSIPKPLVYRVMWVVLGRVSDLSVKKPYGDVLPYKMEDEYE